MIQCLQQRLYFIAIRTYVCSYVNHLKNVGQIYIFLRTELIQSRGRRSRSPVRSRHRSAHSHHGQPTIIRSVHDPKLAMCVLLKIYEIECEFELGSELELLVSNLSANHKTTSC